MIGIWNHCQLVPMQGYPLQLVIEGSNIRDGTKDAPGENGQFGVSDESHGGIVVALDPEVDAPADLLEESGRWTLSSWLALCSLRWGTIENQVSYLITRRHAMRTHGMNLGRMLVRMKVREWKSENVAKGMMDTGRSAFSRSRKPQTTYD